VRPSFKAPPELPAIQLPVIREPLVKSVRVPVAIGVVLKREVQYASLHFRSQNAISL